MVENDQKVALLAIGVNLGLFCMKYLFARYSGSIVLNTNDFDKANFIFFFEYLCHLTYHYPDFVIFRKKSRNYSKI
jgi:hypothetical protein